MVKILGPTKFCPQNHQTNFLRPYKKSLSGSDTLLPSETDYKCWNIINLQETPALSKQKLPFDVISKTNSKLIKIVKISTKICLPNNPDFLDQFGTYQPCIYSKLSLLLKTKKIFRKINGINKPKIGFLKNQSILK